MDKTSLKEYAVKVVNKSHLTDVMDMKVSNGIERKRTDSNRDCHSYTSSTQTYCDLD